jgi:hypothetical protein
MKRALPLLFLGLATASSAPAAAYVRTVTDRNVPVKWPRSCVTLLVHTAAPPPNLTPALALSAAQAAAAAWTAPSINCTNWRLDVQGVDSADALVANDKINNMVFRTGSWGYDPSALAITTVFAQQSDGQIVDADVELNAAINGKFRWGDLVSGTGGAGVEDLQNTLTHEFGHLLGLDHNCFLPGNPRRGVDNLGNAVPDCERSSAEVQEATMFAAVSRGDIMRRTLAADDIAGVCAIYPASTTACVVVPGSGAGGSAGTGGAAGDGGGETDKGCSMGHAGGSGGILLAALALFGLSARRLGRRPREQARSARR